MTVIADEEQLISAAAAGNPDPKSLPHSFQQGSGSAVDMTWLIKQGNFIWREQTGWPEENVSDLCLCITSRKFKTFGQEIRFKVAQEKYLVTVTGACKSILGLRVREHAPTTADRV